MDSSSQKKCCTSYDIVWAPVLLFLLLPCALSAAPALRFDGTRAEYDLQGHLEAAEDPSGQLTIEEVSGPESPLTFSPVPSGHLNLGGESSVRWVRFEMDARGVTPEVLQQAWFLRIGWPNFRTVTVFFADRSTRPVAWPSLHGGEIPPMAGGPTERRPLIFRVPISCGQLLTVFVRLESEWSMFLRAKIVEESTLSRQDNMVHFWLGIYYGIMLSLALYNLFVGWFLRDRSYLLYVIYVVALSGYFSGINGLTTRFVLPGHSEQCLRATLMALGVASVAITSFVRSFLMCSTHTPRLDKVLKGVAAIGLILTFVGPWAPTAALSRSFTLIGFVFPPVVLGAAIFAWRHGFRPARYFLLAWSAYCVGMLMYALVFADVVHYTPWTFNAFQISSAIEACLLSLALADRMRTLRLEREDLARSARRFRTMAHTDALTRLFNVRYFHERLAAEIHGAEQRNQHLSLLVLDVDDFKRLNDTFGHMQGDHVLAALGDVLRTSTRGTDVACRYGGEEFAVILPNTVAVMAAEVAERVRARLEAHDFVAEAGTFLRVTASIGFAEYRKGEGPAAFVDRADRALYQAKSAGKNRVFLACA